MYHKVDIVSPSMWWVDVHSFYQQMLGLRDKRVVYLDEYDPADDKQVVISFDGVYQNVFQYAAPVLQALGYPFELFVTSEFIGMENRFDVGEPPCRFASVDELSGLVAMGGRLQWHTKSHQLMTGASGAKSRDLLVRELDVPEELKRIDPDGLGWFAYPYGEFDAWLRDEVAKRFVGAVSCNQGSELDRYAFNRVTVVNETNLRSKSIAVIVVSHNYGEFLHEAIESVLHQTYSPDSILIMDDASDDMTPEIAQSYRNLYPNLISFLRNDTRQGIVNTFNRAVQATKSDYICFLGADNRFQSNYLERIMKVFAEDPKVGIAYTDFLLFGGRAQEEYLLHPAERRGRVIDGMYYEISFPEFTRNALRSGNFIHGSSAYSRSAFESVGGYIAHGRRPEDANLFKRMIEAGCVAKKASGAYLEYRQHSLDQANVVARAAGQVEFYRLYAKRLEFKVKALERAYRALSPLVRVASVIEKLAFELMLRMAKWWRRRF